MATQSEINASLGLPPGINPDGSWNVQDYLARKVSGQVDTQAQVDAANAANPYSAQNMAKVDITRPGQYVQDAEGNYVALSANSPGFNINNPTALTYLGELSAKGGTSSAAEQFNAIATPAQKTEAARLWSVEKARLEEIDRQAALAAQPTGLLKAGGQNLSFSDERKTESDAGTTRQAMSQAMETVGVKKTYTDAEIKQALRDLSWLEPNASIKDIISAAATYGIGKDKVVEHLSSFTYTTKNVDKLAQQILAQNTTATWKGDVKPATAARYMADDLAKSGITDISQVGKTASGIINKETGQKLISGYGERTKGNLWSGSYEGGGNTGFGVQFTDSGAPMFYTEGASSSTLKKDLIKAAIVAGAVVGIVGPESLSGIFGSGASALTATEAAGLGLTATEAAGLGFTAAELTAAGYTAAEIAGTTAVAGGTTGLLTGATDVAATTVADAATGLTASQLTTAAKLGLTAAQYAGLISAGGQTAAGLLQQQTSKEAADKARAMIDTETAAAKASAAFKPVGMTTRFGTSEFKTDPVTGQITSAGYTLSPEAKYAQDFFRTQANLGLEQVELAPFVYAPLKTGANMMFDLGQQALNQPTDARLGQIATDYLTQSAGSKALQTLGEKYIAQSPEEVAQNYLNQQMALLQPGRELELANLQNKLQQQGRGGLAVAQGGALGATTPELQALYNARATQEAQLAAGAQQAGQQQVQFGAGLFGTGQQLGMAGQQFGMDTLAKQQALDQQRIGFGAGLYGTGAQTLGNYYGGLAQSYAPYNAAFGQMQALETAGQQPFTLGAQLGQTASTAGAKVGQLGLMGAEQSVALATGKAATTNPYATALGGVTSNPLFTDALTKIAGGTPVNALDFGAYGSGNTGFQKMIDDIYG
jgi:hypothetical protein